MVYTIGSVVVVENEVSKEVVDRGSVWKELLFAFIDCKWQWDLRINQPLTLKVTISLPFFTQGIESDALTTVAHAGHFTSRDHVPWSTTASILAAIIAAPVFCYVADKFGRKVGIFVICLVQGISCIPLLLDISEINIMALHILAGISSGGLFTVFPMYIREVSSTANRGFALSLFMPMTAGGYLLNLTNDLDTLSFFMVAIVVVQVIMVFCLVESPSYLVMVGDYERAKINISKLKCLPTEHPTVISNLQSLKEESDRAKSHGKLHTITILRNPIWRDATKIGLVLHSTMILGGSILFLDQDKTLAQLKLPEDPDKLLTLVCFFAGSMMCTVLIRVMERSYLLTSAYAIMVLSMGTLAVYTQADLTVYTFRRVPVAALGVLLIGYGAVWGLPTVVVAELFNIEIRSHQLALLYVYSQLIKLAHVHSFPYIEDLMGVYSVFYIFVGVNLFGAVYSLFHIPELKNKTTRQVERQLKRVPLLKM